MDELKEKIARALCLGMYGVPSREYDRLHDDSKEELRISAAAAFRAIEEAGYVVVPKEPTAAMIEAGRISDPLSCDVDENDIAMVYGRIYEGMISAVSGPLNLEEPRG